MEEGNFLIAFLGEFLELGRTYECFFDLSADSRNPSGIDFGGKYECRPG